MNDVEAAVERWRAAGVRVALATVVSARRSAPRPVGTMLAVSETGDVIGSVSGGCIEPDVVEHAQEVLATRRPRVHRYGIEDEVAWGVGLPCGGEIEIFVEPLERSAPVTPPPRAGLLTVIAGDGLGTKRVVPEGEDEDVDELLRSARSDVIERRDERLFCAVPVAVVHLLVFGAVDLADALAEIARTLGWRTTIADARAGLVTRERIPSADDLVVAWPEAVFDRVSVDRDAAVVVVSHDEKLDLPALVGALRTDAFYIGALGSRRTQSRRREQMLELGVEPEALARIAGPCGLDVGARTPAETALSIAAEIVAARAGRGGGPLSETSGPIHAAAV